MQRPALRCAPVRLLHSSSGFVIICAAMDMARREARRSLLGSALHEGYVCAQTPGVNPYERVLMAFIRLFFPIWFAYLLIMVAFRIGVKKKRDK